MSSIKNAKRMLEVVMKDSKEKTFNQFLSVGLMNFLSVDMRKELSLRYKIPRSLCRLNSTNHIFSSACILALFDEFSTYSLVIKDKKYRPGVSVYLQAEIIRPAFVDDTVIFTSKVN